MLYTYMPDERDTVFHERLLPTPGVQGSMGDAQDAMVQKLRSNSR